MALDNVKFRRPVVPGDQLRLEVTLLQGKGRTRRLKGEAYVEGQLACGGGDAGARGRPVTGHPHPSHRHHRSRRPLEVIVRL